MESVETCSERPQPQPNGSDWLATSMQRRQLPTDAQIVLLKRELNFLLWTKDPPRIPESVQRLVAPGVKPEAAPLNMQCTSHVVVTSALFLRRGFAVTTRGGRAFVLEPAPDHNPANDCLNEIAKHWWFTVEGHGLVDLSLFAESEHPLVYCNRSIGERWQIHFSDRPDKLSAFLKDRERGCFYLTVSKKSVMTADLEQSLAQPLPPAKAIGIPLTYARLVEHCERLLTGLQESLTHINQTKAWESLVN